MAARLPRGRGSPALWRVVLLAAAAAAAAAATTTAAAAAATTTAAAAAAANGVCSSLDGPYCPLVNGRAPPAHIRALFASQGDAAAGAAGARLPAHQQQLLNGLQSVATVLLGKRAAGGDTATARERSAVLSKLAQLLKDVHAERRADEQQASGDGGGGGGDGDGDGDAGGDDVVGHSSAVVTPGGEDEDTELTVTVDSMEDLDNPAVVRALRATVARALAVKRVQQLHRAQQQQRAQQQEAAAAAAEGDEGEEAARREQPAGEPPPGEPPPGEPPPPKAS